MIFRSLRFDPDADRDAPTYKLPVVKRFVRDRPAAWVDDELGEDVIAWADQREQPTMLVHCDPRVGLTDEHVDDLLAFAARPTSMERTERIVRDPERIPIVLAAIEREWRKHPDQRLGQLVVNLLRRHGTVPPEDEGQVLFAVEDGELLRWLGAETDDEQRYIEDERAASAGSAGVSGCTPASIEKPRRTRSDFWWQSG